MTFTEYLKSINAYSDAVKWAENKTIEEVVATCHRGDWFLWLAKKCDIGLQSLTLAKSHCANTVRHLMKDERSIKAVDIATAFGEGRATRKELDYAAANAYVAADAAVAADVDAYADAAYAAYAAADADAAAAAAAVYAAVGASDANRLQTADICRKYIGDLIIQKVNSITKPSNQ
jgi:hypothetical protein